MWGLHGGLFSVRVNSSQNTHFVWDEFVAVYESQPTLTQTCRLLRVNKLSLKDPSAEKLSNRLWKINHSEWSRNKKKHYVADFDRFFYICYFFQFVTQKCKVCCASPGGLAECVYIRQ